MGGYVKLFASILDSSLWELSKEAKILFITMLAKKDRDQIVDAAVPGLAHAARLTIDETLAALEELQRPDKWSKNKEHDGRRIVKVDRGWLVVSGTKYRDMLTAEKHNQYAAEWQHQYRIDIKSGKRVPKPGGRRFGGRPPKSPPQPAAPCNEFDPNKPPEGVAEVPKELAEQIAKNQPVAPGQ